MKFRYLLAAASILFSSICLADVTTSIEPVLAQTAPVSPLKQAYQQQNQRNYKDALEKYKKILTNPANSRIAGKVLKNALRCQQRLNQIAESDKLVEETLRVFPQNFGVLWAAANFYHSTDHYGNIIGNKFIRGHRYSTRGSGRHVDSLWRDRAMALRLYLKAIPFLPPKNKQVKHRFYQDLALCICLGKGTTSNSNYGYYSGNSWRLQNLTDLTKLPDYDPPGQRYRSRKYAAPVDSKGNPVFYYHRDKFDDCRNDGERWRWVLEQQYGKNQAILSREWIDFLKKQFSVSTLGNNSYVTCKKDTFDRLNKIYSFKDLSDDETVALTTDGIKKFKLPPEFNFITLAIKSKHYDTAINEYLNRLQFTKALEFAREFHRKNYIRDIADSRGDFISIRTEPSGTAPKLTYIYRNAKEVKLTATRLDSDAIIKDMKEFLQSNPLKIPRKKIQIESIGYRIIMENQEKFLIKSTVQEWTQKLDPGTEHYKRVADLKMPFKKPGAYLVKAEVSPKSISYIVVWLTDTIIARNQHAGNYVYIAVDAETGKPLKDAEFKFFSYDIKRLKKPVGSGKKKRRFNVVCREFQKKAEKGITTVKPDREQHRENLLIEVSSIGNRGVMGFNAVWHSRYSAPAEYNQRKIFCATDRPVYRPEQTVKFKAWGAQVSYIKDLNNPYAGAPLKVVITSPDGTKIYNKTLTADEFGGVDGEVKLPEAAKLGNYNIRIGKRGYRSFRVEEYKKPEFEVIVKGPNQPLLLGDKFKVDVTAKYYFGQPVENAKVTYKVERRQVDKILYPWHSWDWLYGNGYWWDSVYWSYNWLPNIKDWCVYSPPLGHGNSETVASGSLELHKGKASIEISSEGLKQLYGDIDSEYTVEVSVTDESRRMISGSASIQVPAKPFTLFIWPNRGFYHPGEVVRINTQSISPAGQKVETTETAELYKIKFDKDGKVSETKIGSVSREQDKTVKFKPAEPGLYKLQCTATDSKGNKVTGGCVIQVIGEKTSDTDYRFNEIELHADKQTYEAGNTVKLLINTRQKNATVFLLRSPGKEIVPEVITLKGQSIIKEFKVTRRDMPNCFVKAFTITDGRMYEQQIEIRIPPDNKVIDVDVTPAKAQVSPGKMTAVNIKLTDSQGKPINQQIAVSVYDKSIEYIAQSNIPDIRKFFWSWQHHYYSEIMTNALYFNNIHPQDSKGVETLGCFDYLSIYIPGYNDKEFFGGGMVEINFEDDFAGDLKRRSLNYAPAAKMRCEKAFDSDMEPGNASFNDIKVRSEFADTAYWAAALTPDKNGNVRVTFKAPENLTTWKIKVWAMSKSSQVGQGEAEFVTSKDFLLRLQTPRFLVESDRTVISANIHSYRKTGGKTSVQLSFEGDSLKLSDKEKATKTIMIPAGGEARVNWNVDAVKAGKAAVTVKAVTDGASDAMQLKLPVIVHGITKQVAASGKLSADAPDTAMGTMIFELPEDRDPEASRLQINFSPTLAGAVLDALPYLLDYPYGCTEQTLNRFLPAVFAKKTLQDIGITLPEIDDKRTNLNAGELGDDKKRAAQWKRYKSNPVFSQKELDKIVKAGINRLDDMQNRDGGWGWFSGYGERSYPHTTAQVVRGLIAAKACGVMVRGSMLEQGIKWLEDYQQQQIKKIDNYPTKTKPYKRYADNMDAFVFMVLVKAGKKSPAMQKYLYRDRIHLSVYSLSLFGIALERLKAADQLKMVMDNIRQYVKENKENQTAWLDMGSFRWWYWYGSDTEAMASYIKLLCARGTKPDMETASLMVKYLLNNRKHATYWNSTRDTALCAEALCVYLKKSGEMSPDMTVNIFVDGKQRKTVKITKDNLFSYDSSLILRGNELTTGKHKIEISRTGKGPVYYNGYLSYFSKEKFITKTGLDIKIVRNYYHLKPETVSGKEQGLKQVVDVKREKYKRIPVKSPAEFKSGDIFEVELIVDSSNDYEYIMLTDFKPAGAEAMDVRSGYTSGSSLWPYMEFRDTKVCMFIRRMPRGTHSITYRLRAETPGKYSALPAKAEAMYAPELKANSNERKVDITE